MSSKSDAACLLGTNNSPMPSRHGFTLQMISKNEYDFPSNRKTTLSSIPQGCTPQHDFNGTTKPILTSNSFINPPERQDSSCSGRRRSSLFSVNLDSNKQLGVTLLDSSFSLGHTPHTSSTQSKRSPRRYSAIPSSTGDNDEYNTRLIYPQKHRQSFVRPGSESHSLSELKCSRQRSNSLPTLSVIPQTLPTNSTRETFSADENCSSTEQSNTTEAPTMSTSLPKYKHFSLISAVVGFPGLLPYSNTKSDPSLAFTVYSNKNVKSGFDETQNATNIDNFNFDYSNQSLAAPFNTPSSQEIADSFGSEINNPGIDLHLAENNRYTSNSVDISRNAGLSRSRSPIALTKQSSLSSLFHLVGWKSSGAVIDSENTDNTMVVTKSENPSENTNQLCDTYNPKQTQDSVTNKDCDVIDGRHIDPWTLDPHGQSTGDIGLLSWTKKLGSWIGTATEGPRVDVSQKDMNVFAPSSF